MCSKLPRNIIESNKTNKLPRNFNVILIIKHLSQKTNGNKTAQLIDIIVIPHSR